MNFDGNFNGNFNGNLDENFVGNFDGNVDGHFNGNFDGNFDINFMGILRMDSMGWPYNSSKCLSFFPGINHPSHKKTRPR